jgi:hypothetical protein
MASSYFPAISNPTAEFMVAALFILATLLIAMRFQDTLVDTFGKNIGTAPYWT